MRPSTARVAPEPDWIVPPQSPAEVLVIDTGLPVGPHHNGGVLDLAFLLPPGPDVPDSNFDAFLDPVAGHGTFVTGLIALLGNPRLLDSRAVVPAFGFLSVAQLFPILVPIVARPNPNLIINMSFASRSRSDAISLGTLVTAVQLTGAVVVASAGNDASPRRTYPAALPEVVGVGGLGPYGPAPFTNYGDWVRACAPAVNVVSTFFRNWNGGMLRLDAMLDPDDFDGWAVWSGTSFAAPAVVAALCREMQAYRCNAQEAVERVVDNPARVRVLGLGTVINLAL